MSRPSASRDIWSAQWRSSTTTTNGRPAALFDHQCPECFEDLDAPLLRVHRGDGFVAGVDREQVLQVGGPLLGGLVPAGDGVVHPSR